MTEELDDGGPKLRALPTEGMRKFVLAYARNGGNAVQAAIEAGSTGPKVYGWRLLQRQDVQAALDEVMAGSMKELTPGSLHALKALVEDPNHKDHAKAVFAVLDRGGLFPTKTEHHTRVDHTMIADKDLVAAIKKLAGEVGFDEMQTQKLIGREVPKRLPPVVVDAEVVEDESEDWLT